MGLSFIFLGAAKIIFHNVDTRNCTLYFFEFTLQKVDVCDCTLPFPEFGLWLATKSNQVRRGPTIIITLTRYWNLIMFLLLSYLVWILISIIGFLSKLHHYIVCFQVNNKNNSNWSRNVWHPQCQKAWEKDYPWVSSMRTDPQQILNQLIVGSVWSPLKSATVELAS